MINLKPRVKSRLIIASSNPLRSNLRIISRTKLKFNRLLTFKERQKLHNILK